MNDTPEEGLVHIADFPEQINLSVVLTWLTERDVRYKVVKSGQSNRLFVEQEKAQAVADFLNSLKGAKPQSDSKALSFSVKAVYRAWPVTLTFILLGILGAVIVSNRQSAELVLWLTYLEPFKFPRFYDFATTYLQHHQWWRLLTPAFLHFGVFHIIFNSLAMWELGRRLEKHMGSAWYLLFCVSAGIAANVCQFLLQPQSTFGGLSGIVFGLFGAIAVLHWLVKDTYLFLPKGMYVFAFGSLVLGFTPVLDMLFGVSVANGAHLGGLVFGALFALLFYTFKKTALND